MNFTSKLIAILLVLGMMCAIFMGCNTTTDPQKNPTQNPGGNPGNSTTEATTQAPAPEKLTQHGNHSTESPVLSLEEIFAKDLQNDENTFAAGSSYSDEKLANVFKIADCIARYQEFVEEYRVQEQLDQLYEETGFTLDVGFGADMMKHYLSTTGESYDYTDRMEELLSHPKVGASQTACISAAMKAAENLVANGETVPAINQTKPMNFKSLKSQDGTVYYALGTYHTMADLSNVQRTGDTMSAVVTFRIVDYYDWAENVTEPEFASYLNKLDDTYRALLAELIDIPTLEGFCQKDMAQLHNAGFAKNYLAQGVITYNVTWTVGQTFDQATVTPAQ